MAHYCLLLDCSTGSNNAEQEGLFDNVQWVSYDGGNTSNPNTQSQSLSPGDWVTFAVQVKDGNGTSQAGWLQWLVAIVNASTQPGNRQNRQADNNSPFRIGGKVQTYWGANAAGAGNLSTFTTYDSTGQVNSQGTYLGFPYEQVVADVPPGKSSPDRSVSQYEAVLVASVTTTPSPGQIWQFGYDPEMDVNNN
jgi:hypothetical protein